MYYYYNQFLRAILTAERWATADDLQSRSRSFITLQSSEVAKDVLNRLKLAFGKDASKYIILMKESTVRVTEKWPDKMPGAKENEIEIVANHGRIIGHLLQQEAGNVQLRESRFLFPTADDPENIQPPTVVDVLPMLPPKEEELENTIFSDYIEGRNLDFTEIHRNFSEKKQISMIEEDGKTIFLKSSLSFDGYHLTQDIGDAAFLLGKIFKNIEDICLNYGGTLRDLDAQISDELHFIEFADMGDSSSAKSYKRLQDLRVKRRCVKDSMKIADLLVKTIGTDLPDKLSYVSDKITNWDERSYMVRVPEEFKH